MVLLCRAINNNRVTGGRKNCLKGAIFEDTEKFTNISRIDSKIQVHPKGLHLYRLYTISPAELEDNLESNCLESGTFSWVPPREKQVLHWYLERIYITQCRVSSEE